MQIFRKQNYQKQFIDETLYENLQTSSKTEEGIDFQSVLNQVERIIEMLPEKQKIIFRKSRLEGMSTKEIAEELKLTPGTIDNYIKIYGFGLQNNTFQHRGFRKEIRVNSWFTDNVDFSHAPVPFYVSTKGYGVFVDTSRYATFYCGTMRIATESVNLEEGGNANVASSTIDLYKPLEKSSSSIITEVP